MATTRVSRTINAPIEQVWATLADFGTTYRWNPEVIHSTSIGDRATGLGAERRCELNDTGSKWITEEIVAFDGPGHRYTVKLTGGPSKPPIEEVLVDIGATASTATSTEVTMAATLNGNGPVQRAMATMGALAMKRVLSRVAAGLEHHLITGEDVTSRR
ncbi:MAG: SRPBCC family protein [Acidimicrobiia bacterium]|nr:SRPBCC family protein [Acidimicrobiia bacterium]